MPIPPYPFRASPFIVLVIGVAFIFTLLGTIKPDVFFSGDAGLKYLMVKQISRGGSFHTLDLAAPSWVKEIWQEGFYPFKTPFVYDGPHGKLVSFPPAFQWLNSSFFSWFGYKGIYIIPCCSVMTVWVWLMAVLKRVGVTPLLISMALLLFTLGSPLSLYAAVYWEHTLAVLLLFGAVAFLVAPPASYLVAIALGLSAGAAVWLRPEMLLLDVLFIAIVLHNYFRNRSKTDIMFIVSALATIGAFLLFNYLIDGNVLGAHSYQLLNTNGVFANKLTILTHINARLIIYFPAILFVYALGAYMLIRKDSFPRVIRQLTLIIMLFSLLTPFLLPNAGGKQWGPRYFLPLVPMVITTLGLAASHIDAKMFRQWKWITVITALLTYSVYLNTYLSYASLHDDYAYRVTPGLHLLNKNECAVLVVQNQYIAQEFATILEKKNVFLAETQEDFTRLQKLLEAAGISRIIFLASDPYKIFRPHNLLNGSSELLRAGDYYFAEYQMK